MSVVDDLCDKRLPRSTWNGGWELTQDGLEKLKVCGLAPANEEFFE